jgi:hypothetical protein
MARLTLLIINARVVLFWARVVLLFLVGKKYDFHFLCIIALLGVTLEHYLKLKKNIAHE